MDTEFLFSFNIEMNCATKKEELVCELARVIGRVHVRILKVAGDEAAEILSLCTAAADRMIRQSPPAVKARAA